MPDPSINLLGEMMAAIGTLGIVWSLPINRRVGVLKIVAGLAALDSALKLASFRATVAEALFHSMWITAGIIIFRHPFRQNHDG